MANKFLIQHPIVSEKTARGAVDRKYAFVVRSEGTKPEIAKAIAEIYKVHVVRVTVTNVKPKVRRLGRSVGTKPGYRKATVTLREGEKLDVIPQ
jgi:large subunit ribosomal protein L23